MSVTNRYSPDELVHEDESTIIRNHARKLPSWRKKSIGDGDLQIDVYTRAARRLSEKGDAKKLAIQRELTYVHSFEERRKTRRRVLGYDAKRREFPLSRAKMDREERIARKNLHTLRGIIDSFEEGSDYYQNLLETARQNAWKMGNVE